MDIGIGRAANAGLAEDKRRGGRRAGPGSMPPPHAVSHDPGPKRADTTRFSPGSWTARPRARGGRARGRRALSRGCRIGLWSPGW